MNCAAECCIECYSTIELLRIWIEITFKITIRITIQLVRHGPLVIVIGTCCYIYIRLKYYICGRARAVSGNTMMIGNETVRINGIVALRQGQMLHFKSGEWKNGFQYSKQALVKMVDGKRVCCRVTKRHGAYGRVEGVCSVWFRDIGKGMVRQGYAFADREYSDRYVGDEKFARRKRKGFHAAVPPPVNPKKEWDEAEKEARDFLVGRFRERRLSGDPSVMTIKELSVELGFDFKGGVIIDPGGELIPIELG
jgi:endonuclease YncB( thermonuclease family)